MINIENMIFAIDLNNKSFKCKFSQDSLTFKNYGYDLTIVSGHGKLIIYGDVYLKN